MVIINYIILMDYPLVSPLSQEHFIVFSRSSAPALNVSFEGLTRFLVSKRELWSQEVNVKRRLDSG